MVVQVALDRGATEKGVPALRAIANGGCPTCRLLRLCGTFEGEHLSWFFMLANLSRCR